VALTDAVAATRRDLIRRVTAIELIIDVAIGENSDLRYR
jgi:hypothetical protein